MQFKSIISVLSDYGNQQLPDSEALAEARKLLEKIAENWSQGNQRLVSIWAPQSKDRIARSDYFLKEFYASSQRFTQTKDAVQADNACLRSRFATTMFFTAWADYNPIKRKIIAKNLVDEMTTLRKSMQQVADTLPKGCGNKLNDYATNIGGRAHFLSVLSTNGAPAARQGLKNEWAVNR